MLEPIELLQRGCVHGDLGPPRQILANDNIFVIPSPFTSVRSLNNTHFRSERPARPALECLQFGRLWNRHATIPAVAFLRRRSGAAALIGNPICSKNQLIFGHREHPRFASYYATPLCYLYARFHGCEERGWAGLRIRLARHLAGVPGPGHPV
jgi:hypothetical protein